MSRSGIHQLATEVTQYPNQGFIGMLADLPYGSDRITYSNSAPQSVQVDTLSLAAPSEGDAIGFTIDFRGYSQTFSYTAGAGDSETVAAQTLCALVGDSPAVNGLVECSVDGSDLVLTGRSVDVYWTASGASGLTIASVPAGSAAPIPFGRAVVISSPVTDREGCAGCSLPSASVEVPGGLTLGDLFGGISYATYDEAFQRLDQEIPEYAPRHGVKALRTGKVWVAVEDEPGPLSPAFFGSQAGEEGKIFSAAGAGRFQIPHSRLVKKDSQSGLWILELNPIY